MSDIHDRIFKEIITDRTMAISFLKTHLPKELAKKIDFRTVKLNSANVEHVRQQHKQNFKSKEQSDLVFQYKFKSGELGACITHIEAQTSSDITFLLRVRHYQTAYLLDFLKRNKTVKKLPLITSILFYANKKPFKFSLDLNDYFENPKLAKEYAFSHTFIDINRLSDEEINNHGIIAGFEFILKHIRNNNIDGNLEIAARYLVHYDNYITQTLIRYMSRHSDLAPETFYDRIIDEQPKLEGILMTVAEQLERRGMEKGIQQGLEQGRTQEQLKMARKFLDMGFSVDEVAQGTGLNKNTIKNLKNTK
jgi:predicted transposase/invertase (TIGR01784 family)